MTYSERPTVGATRARQGRFGRHVLWVLVFGTLLAALGLFAAWTWKSGDLAATTADNGARKPEAAAFDAPPPAAATRQNYQQGGPLAPAAGNPQNPNPESP